MARYGTTHNVAASSAETCLIFLPASATVRVAIYDCIWGSDAVPADQAGEFTIRRSTTDPITGTALDEFALDPLSPTTGVAALGGTFATEPVYVTGNLLSFGLHQRATFRWVAFPGGEIHSVSGAANGLNLSNEGHGATPTMAITVYWAE